MGDLVYAAVTSSLETLTISLTGNNDSNINNNSNNSIEELDYEEVHNMDTTPAFAKVIRDIILPVICACGIIGIILTVIVLSRKNMSTSTNCYLMGLAFADLFFLIILTTRLSDSIFATKEGSSYYMYQIYATYATMVMNIFLLISIWITVMLAVERYIAICKPFMAVKMCTVHKARIIILVIFLACVICRLPNFFEYKIVSLDIDNNTRLMYPAQTELGKDPRYHGVYPWIVDVIIMSIIPFVMLLILNMCLIWEVRKSTAYIQQNLMVVHGPNNAHTVHKEELQITFMLISVIIVFFICQAPYVTYMAVLSLNAFMTTPGFLLFRYIAMLLLTLKSAVNFILYCWFSEKFWTTLKRIFCAEQCLRHYLSRNNKPGENQNGNYFNLKRFSSTGNTRVTFVTEHE